MTDLVKGSIRSQIVPIRRSKRIFDLISLVISSPFVFTVFLMICTAYIAFMVFYPDERGALFHSERRYSRGKIFNIIKFRTIRDDVLREITDREKENVFVKKLEQNRSNLTRLGFVLKQLYLDEIPQFWCILKGEMSLVGPRPWAVVETERSLVKGHYNKFVCWPGLLGFVQVQKDDPVDNKVSRNDNCIRNDNIYLKLYNEAVWWQLLKMDARIVLKAFIIVVKAEGL